ncbi:MAG: FkbM family methyltransferase [Saprospiraceae bacterium]|nr:FkbM family methyltransferase [Saprospiraceae bacterium]
MQVGAFDGVECDPLYKYLQKYKWKGAMLEPQPMPFEKLKKLYSGIDGITVINAAISKTLTKAILYTLEGDTLPNWSKGMATFDKASILKHDDLIPGIEHFIKPIEIPCLPFEEVINLSALKHLDLLQVDTEGFDAEIIRMFPFDILQPSIIHFESKHLNKHQLEEVLELLINKGYKVGRDGQEDMLAYNEIIWNY